jgi:hypothetical protein
MKGDVQICTAVCSAASDYAMTSGFYLTIICKPQSTEIVH